ncbi:MAG: hypothetical protein LJE69_18900 [Thiohalocapsa sp.]|uniref:hypothetical protein n=1 Tax=Thiohalocapsa sp. TaxID=2497641 RepID=UPI0025F16F78|nr:hypothetical protein [Thiohalocapsa sp.]MCG6943306.1 hypothetical protein [Thiohalocapsa sp.]
MAFSPHLRLSLPAAVLVSISGLYSAIVIADEEATLAEPPAWQCGDSWILEQTKLDISAPTPYWKEPLRWRCEVMCDEGPDRLSLQIRTLSGPPTGVDVIVSTNPWRVLTIRKVVATADGLQTLEEEVNTDKPILEEDAPFALVIPSFPLQDTPQVTAPSPVVLNSENGDTPAATAMGEVYQEVLPEEGTNPLVSGEEMPPEPLTNSAASEFPQGSTEVKIGIGRQGESKEDAHVLTLKNGEPWWNEESAQTTTTLIVPNNDSGETGAP